MSGKIKRHPADVFCADLFNRYPYSLESADMVRRDRSIIVGDFPDWCALPTTFVASIIAGTNDMKTILQVLNRHTAYELTAALIWARNKMVYRFDDTLADTLAAQHLDSKIPIEILDYLPYPCVYIERSMNIEGQETTGFFAWLDWGTKENKRLLILLFTTTDNKPLRIVLPISGGTIADSILEIANTYPNIVDNKVFTVEDVHTFEAAQSIIECINLLLYLCSEKPDMPDDTELRTRRSRDTFGNSKRAAVWEVGMRIGAVLRKAIEPDSDSETVSDNPSHTSHRPHMRRAHWHSFWTGKRNSTERKLILRWLPPIAVNVENTELPTVIHPVKK